MRTNVLVSYFCWYFSPKFQILVIVPQEVLASMRLVVLNVSVLQATTAPAVNNPSANGKIPAFLEFVQVLTLMHRKLILLQKLMESIHVNV